MNKASVTIILPTFQEFDSLPSLIESVEQVRTTSLPNLRLIIVDDDSKDGTEQLIRDLGREWVTLITRTEDRGLSPAVIEGIQVSISEYCGNRRTSSKQTVSFIINLKFGGPPGIRTQNRRFMRPML